MWLSRQMRSAPPTADADLGVTTIAGDSVGVMTRGEVRSLPVYGPGGEEQSVTGMLQKQPPKGMQPGEVYIYGPGGNSIYLQQDGTVEIQGRLVINGEAYAPCTCDKEVL